ncbi:MAG: hypothetical protein K9G24_05395, partial [Candidatus Nanopelagicales bacterium]|nr:hypothetical protein [Candidatus Nanopelagicales bacterium]
LKDELVPIAQRQHDEPTAFIDNRKLFGDLVDDPRFREPYVATLGRLHRDGARATVAWLVQEGTTS